MVAQRDEGSQDLRSAHLITGGGWERGKRDQPCRVCCMGVENGIPRKRALASVMQRAHGWGAVKSRGEKAGACGGSQVHWAARPGKASQLARGTRGEGYGSSRTSSPRRSRRDPRLQQSSKTSAGLHPPCGQHRFTRGSKGCEWLINLDQFLGDLKGKAPQMTTKQVPGGLTRNSAASSSTEVPSHFALRLTLAPRCCASLLLPIVSNRMLPSSSRIPSRIAIEATSSAPPLRRIEESR